MTAPEGVQVEESAQAEGRIATRVTRNRPALAEAVIRELVEEIVTEKYTPGSALPSTSALCDEYLVSRTVIREVFTALSQKGLVASRQGWGTVVLDRQSWRLLDPVVLEALFHRDDRLAFMDQVITIRASLEATMAAIAADVMRVEDHAALDEGFAELEGALGDPSRYDEVDRDFHAVIHRLSGNDLGTAIIAAIQGKAHLMAEYSGVPPADHQMRTHAEHREILAALKEGRADDAAALMRAHICDSWTRRRPGG